jgi:hypothetical protein
MEKIFKLFIFLFSLTILIAGCGGGGGGGAAPITSAKIVYVSDFFPSADATAFKTFLEAAGHTVTIIVVGDILSTDFSTANLIIVKTSALSASDWNGAFAPHAAALYATHKPILSIYLGDYLFDSSAFDLFIDHGQSASGNASSVKVDNASDQFWSTPHTIAVTTGVNLAIYTFAQPDEEVYWSSPPATAHKFVTDPSDSGYSVLNYQLINSTRYFHWGTEGRPTDMTTDGQNLFLNVVYWMVNG